MLCNVVLSTPLENAAFMLEKNYKPAKCLDSNVHLLYFRAETLYNLHYIKKFYIKNHKKWYLYVLLEMEFQGEMKGFQIK